MSWPTPEHTDSAKPPSIKNDCKYIVLALNALTLVIFHYVNFQFFSKYFKVFFIRYRRFIIGLRHVYGGSWLRLCSSGVSVVRGYLAVLIHPFASPFLRYVQYVISSFWAEGVWGVHHVNQKTITRHSTSTPFSFTLPHSTSMPCHATPRHAGRGWGWSRQDWNIASHPHRRETLHATGFYETILSPREVNLWRGVAFYSTRSWWMGGPWYETRWSWTRQIFDKDFYIEISLFFSAFTFRLYTLSLVPRNSLKCLFTVLYSRC